METRGSPLAAAGAPLDSVESDAWQTLCTLEAELEAELRDEVSRSAERRKSSDVKSWDSSETPMTTSTTSPSRTSFSNPPSSASPGYWLRRQPHPSWAHSASQSPARVSAPGVAQSRVSTHSEWSNSLGVVVDGFGHPMLPMATSKPLVRTGRHPLRERETRKWAATAFVAADDSPGDGKDSFSGHNGNRFHLVRDEKAGTHNFRGGFVDESPHFNSTRRTQSAQSARKRSSPAFGAVESTLTGGIATERRKKQRPPFVVGVGDSSRARFSRQAKENFSTRVANANLRARRSEGTKKSSPPEGVFVTQETPALRNNSNSAVSATRESKSPRVERVDAEFDFRFGKLSLDSHDANDPNASSSYAAAVDATRLLFDAVEKRVKCALARAMNQSGVVDRDRDENSFALAFPSPASSANAVEATRLRDRRDSTSFVDAISVPQQENPSTELVSPFANTDAKLPVRAMKRSIDAYLSRRRVGGSFGNSAASTPSVVFTAASTPTEKTKTCFENENENETETSSPKKALDSKPLSESPEPLPPTLVSERKPLPGGSKNTRVPGPNLRIESSDDDEFTYAPVYSPVAAIAAHKQMLSPEKANVSKKTTVGAFSKVGGVRPIRVDLRSRLGAASTSGTYGVTHEIKDTRNNTAKQSDSDASPDETTVSFPKRKILNALAPESSSSDEDENTELFSFCRRYRVSRVTSLVLEKWSCRVRERVQLANAHFGIKTKSLALYGWRLERVEGAVRNESRYCISQIPTLFAYTRLTLLFIYREVATRFSKIATRRRGRKRLAQCVQGWSKETKRCVAFRENIKNTLTRMVGGGAEQTGPETRVRLREISVETSPSERDATTRFEIGTMTEPETGFEASTDRVSEVLRVNASHGHDTAGIDVSRQASSLDTHAVNDVLDTLVRETDQHASCGPLFVATPAALRTGLDLCLVGEPGVSVAYTARGPSATSFSSELTEDSCSSCDDDEESEEEDESHEKPKAASFAAVTKDAADAVGVAVTGLLGLWRISETWNGYGVTDNASHGSLAGRFIPSDARDAARSPPTRALRFDPLGLDAQSDGLPVTSCSAVYKTSPVDRTPRVTSRTHQTPHTPRTPRVVFDAAKKQTMVLLDKGDGSPGNREVYVTMAEYVNYVDAAAVTYV